MQNEPNPFPCHPVVLGSRKCATCFLSHLFTVSLASKKYENMYALIKYALLLRHHVLKQNSKPVSNSVSRHDDVIIEHKDTLMLIK